jgi:hypothetical protein
LHFCTKAAEKSDAMARLSILRVREQQARELRGLEDYRGFYDDDLHLISPVIVGPAMASSRNGRIPESIVTGIVLVCQKNRS